MDPNLPETITAARGGDQAAFDSLFARNLPPLMAFIRMKAGGQILARESVSDLAQSVCREVLMDGEDFEYRGETQFRNWLFLQATRKVMDRGRYLKAAKRDVAQEVSADESNDEAQSLLECYGTFCTPSRAAGAREELARLETAIAQLPEQQRDAIASSRVLGLSYSEVAARMGVTESAVRGLVARGLSRLSGILEDATSA